MLNKYFEGGALVTIGYFLSPLSLWDDAFVNIPISYVGGLIVRLFSPTMFLPSMIIIYWLTNIIGFLCVRKGLAKIQSKHTDKNKRKMIIKDAIASAFYTIVLILLAKYGVINISA